MIDSDLLLKDFFSKYSEEKINEQLFIRNYRMNEEEVLSYIGSLIDIPLTVFIDYVNDSNSASYITFQDVVQFSSFSDATNGICEILSLNDNNGLSNIEIGKALLDDGKERNDGALRKYGENHAKTAIELGLVHSLYGRYYLTCLGMVYNQLEKSVQVALLRRTILRNRFFQKAIKKSQANEVVLSKEMSFLSESTAKRRLPNVRYFFTLLRGQEPEVRERLKNIYIASPNE